MVIVSAEEEVLGSVDVLVAELVVVAVMPLLVVSLAFGDLLVSCHGFLGWSARRLRAARLFLLLPMTHMLSKMRVESVSYNYTIIAISLVNIALKMTKLS